MELVLGAWTVNCNAEVSAAKVWRLKTYREKCPELIKIKPSLNL